MVLKLSLTICRGRFPRQKPPIRRNLLIPGLLMSLTSPATSTAYTNNIMEQYDIVIVGGGMAGLSAALYGGWLGHKVLLAERQMFGGQIINADQVENYPGFPEGILGADLVSQVRTQALKFGATMQYLEITSIEKPDARLSFNRMTVFMARKV